MMGRAHTIAVAAIALSAIAILFSSNGIAEERRPYAEKKEVEPRSGSEACSSRLPLVRSTELDPDRPAEEALKASLGAERHLGVEENVEVREEEGGVFLRVRYPEGSFNFGSADEDTPLGGASFYAPFSSARALCLHYKLRFPDNFAFVKGGKLPGLYAGEAPSGGEKVSGRDGWSVRLMWRKEGQGELYEYIYNKKGKYGLSVGRGQFTFPTGRWISVDLEVVLNEPGARNGQTRLWIDGNPVIEQEDIVFVTGGDDDTESGLMFSTFFGGSSKDWASPKDQHIDFADFRFYAGNGE